MSFAMASHAVRMLWLNLRNALQLTLVPYLVVQAITLGVPLALLGSVATDPFAGLSNAPDLDAGTLAAESQGALAGFFLVQVLVLIGSIVAGAWLAVVWHRFILLEEYPNTAVPPFDLSLVIGYVIRLIVIFCVMVAIGVVGGVALALIGVIVPFIGVFLAIGLGVVMLWASVRLSVMLPSASIGQTMGVSEAWEKTAETQWSLVGATILVAILSMVIAIPAIGLGVLFIGADSQAVSVPQIVINVVFGWIFTMLTVSLATTIYGVAVEGRDLT